MAKQNKYFQLSLKYLNCVLTEIYNGVFFGQGNSVQKKKNFLQ